MFWNMSLEPLRSKNVLRRYKKLQIYFSIEQYSILSLYAYEMEYVENVFLATVEEVRSAVNCWFCRNVDR